MLKTRLTKCFFSALVIAISAIRCFGSQEATTERAHSAIRDAVVSDDKELVQKLVRENSTFVHLLNEEGLTPLHLAAKHRIRPAILQILIDAGANLEAKTDLMKTPLHFAAAEGNNANAQLLLKNQANINAQDQSRRTPLHMVCFAGNLDLTQALVLHGAIISTPDIYGKTPIDIAAQRGHPHIVQFLIRSLPEAEQQAATETSKSKFPEIWEKIALEESILFPEKNEVNDDHRYIYREIEKDHIHCVRAILDNHPVVLTFSTPHQGHPLHFACSLGKLDIVKLLIARGAHVTGRNLNQITPIESAASAGHTHVVRFLLDRPELAGQQEWIRQKIKKKCPQIFQRIEEEEEDEEIYG